MILKCPGQDRRNIKVEELTCLNCGYKIEIFSDELKVKCPKCNNLACRQRMPSCIDWCKSAKSCLGELLWKQLYGGG